MYITQISVYLENNKGTLRMLTKTLADTGVDMLALSVADTTHFGITRIVVRESDVEMAMNALRDNGFVAKKNEVICVAVANQPAGLDGVLKVIEENGISVEYMYSLNYNIGNKALIVLKLAKEGKTSAELQECLAENGVRLINQEEINLL